MRIFLAILLFTALTKVNGTNIVFDRINTEHGLSQNDVLDIYQDKEGFLWFATNEGINRYDGMEFKTYRMSNSNSNSLSSNLIIAFDEDVEGNLWVATQDNGVCKYNPKTETFQRFLNNEENPTLLLSNIVHDIHCEENGNIFIATYYGINYLEPNNDDTYTVHKTEGLPDYLLGGERPRYHKFYQSPVGNLLVLMGHGIAEIKIAPTKSWLDPYFEDLPLYDINGAIDMGIGYIIGHQEGVSYVVPHKSEQNQYDIQTFSCGKVITVVPSNENTIWVGSNLGVFQLQVNTNQEKLFKLISHSSQGNSEYNLSSNNVTVIYQEKNGITWVGTNGGGINKYNPLNRQFRNYVSDNTPGGLNNNKVLSIFEDPEHNMWIGTEGGGINYLSSSKPGEYNKGFTYLYNNIPGEQHIVFDFCAIMADKPEIWAGTGYHARMACLKKISKSKWKVIPSYVPIKRGMVMNIYQDEFKTIWLGTYNGGLFRAVATGNGYKVEQFDMLNSNISSNTIRNFHEDSKGRLWIGSSDGLMVLSRKEKTSSIPYFTIFRTDSKNDSSISHNHVLPIIETKNGDIWIGTMGGGINQYIEGTDWNNGHFRRITSNDGLANNTIKEIVVDNAGIFWIGSNRGLTKFNPKNNKIRNYNINDGLQSYEFVELAGCKRHDGEILMGGINGFNAFYPYEIKEDSSPPNIIFTRLEVMDKPVEINEQVNGNTVLKQSLNSTHTITLRHTENNFSIHFSALHYSNPEFNQYKYRLIGYDPDWIKTTAKLRSAKYTNLDAGHYTFEVTASNCDGYWAEQAKKIDLIIKPPYWQTLWFRSCLVMFILIVLLTFYFLKTRNIKIQKETLQKLVYERTNELLDINTQLEENKEEILAQKEEIQHKRDELQFHKENLEQLIENRTHELQLAKEKAEESDKLKSAFLANMSHEIRTPMNAVVGFSTLLEEEVVNEEERKTFLKQIKQNSEKLLVLIDDILAISLIEANQLKINNHNTSLNSILEDNFLTAQVNCKNKDIAIVLDNQLKTKDIHLYTDSFRINQILTNLLSNAIKFTTSGKITIIAIEDNDGNFQISVRDTGKGIPQDDLNSIFERFRKLDDDPTIIYPGVGLGLSISYKLAELLKCNLWAESEVDKGSEFFLRIPSRFETEQEGDNVKPQLGELATFNNKNILIVEDVMANYQLLERMLDKMGCKVSLAENGLKAINLFKEGKNYDLVLMDIKMPVMNGIEAFLEIKKVAPQQCFIAQTAFALDSDKKRFAELGFDGYISKPIRRKELLDIMEKCFDNK